MKNDLIYIEHVLESISDIHNYTLNMNFVDFSKNKLVQDAVIRKLLVIGEASGKISKEYRNLNKIIPWREIIAMRNKLVHDYMGVDIRIVWETSKKYLPKLQKYFEELI
jgi:uncharacterized protein with HEPN domain